MEEKQRSEQGGDNSRRSKQVLDFPRTKPLSSPRWESLPIGFGCCLTYTASPVETSSSSHPYHSLQVVRTKQLK
jgi:hypothetical protein